MAVEPKYAFVLEMHDGRWVEVHRVEFRAPNNPAQLGETIGRIGRKDRIVRKIWNDFLFPYFNFERNHDYTLELCECFYPFRVTIKRAD